MAILPRCYVTANNAHTSVTSVATSYASWTNAGAGVSGTAPVVGDMLVAVVLCTISAATISQSAGTGSWTIPASNSNTYTEPFTSALAYRVYASGDTAPTWAFGSSSYAYFMCAFAPDAFGVLSFDAEATVKVDTTTATTHTANSATAATAADLSVILTAGRYGTSGSHAISISTHPAGWTAVGIGGYAGTTSFWANTAGAQYKSPVGTGSVAPGASTFNESIAANTYQLLIKEVLGATATPATLAVATATPAPAVTATSPETSPGLEVYGFVISGPQPSDTIEYVQVSVTENQSNAAQAPCTFQLWNGTTAQIGATQTGTASTSTSNVSTAIFTGVTYSELATLRVRVYGNANSGSGYTESVDAVSVTVCYMPQTANANATATPGILAAATAAPVPVVSPLNATATPATLTVTTTQPAAGLGFVPVGNPPGGPWTLAWSEEFAYPNGTGNPNPSVWADHLINGDDARANNTNEVEWYPHNDEGTSISGGVLSLTAINQSPYTADPLCPNPVVPGGQTGTYTSGMLQSHPGFQATYGYFETRVLLPSNINGAWPAVWMLASDNTWPPEIDLAEQTAETYFDQQYTDDVPALRISQDTSLTDWNSPGWHTYGVAWLPGSMTFYFDGTQTATYSGTTILEPCHVILDLAVTTGCTSSNFALQVDYVRYWQFPGVPAAAPAITSVTPATGIPTAGTLQVAFTTVTGATSYRVTVCPVDGDADGWTQTRVNNTGASSPVTVSGMQNGVRYTATVAAVNSSGYSTESPIWPKLPGMPVVSPPVPAAAAAFPAPAIQQEVSPALELYGFGSFPAIGSGDTINSVTVSVAEFQSSSSMGAITFQLWDGTSAQIGTTQAGTASTSSSNASTATFTGVTYSQLATLRVRIFANQDTAAIGATESVDSAELSVSYTPAGGTNATVTPSALAVATSQPAVTVTVPVLASVLAVATTQPAPTVGAAILPYSNPSGGPWVLVFDDEFTDPHGTGLPDWTVWADHLTEGDYYRANDGGTEVQWYTHDHRGESVSGGTLTLTARHESPYTADPLCPSPLPGGQTGTYTSGMIQSHPGFSQTYGYFEARIQLPGTSASPGIWPAFWMYTIDDQWPPEMDIAEYGYPGTDSTWHPPSGSLTTVSAGISDGNWHVYGFRWTASAVTAFIDGTQTLNVTSGLSSYPMMLVLNLAVDTGATGSGYPATMTVDYVRAWTTSGVPAQPAITSLSPAGGVPSSGSLEASFGAVSGATSYRLTVCPFDEHADGISGSHSNYATGSSSPLTVTGLTNGARYTATIAAVNGTGYSTESLPAPAGVLNANALALPAILAVGTAQPAVTVTANANATVTPATLAVATSQPAVSVSGSAIAAPATLAVTAAQPAPAASGSATAALLVLTVTAAQPPPSLSTGQVASPATLAVAAAFPAPAAGGGANPGAAALAVSTTQPAVSAAGGANPAPGAVAVVTAQPATTISTGETASPAPLAASAAFPAPALSTGETASPGTVTATATVPVPAVTAGGSASASPATVTATASLPAPAVAGGAGVSPATLAVATSQPGATAAGGANPAPSALAASTSQPAVQISTGETASPSALAASSSFPAPAVTAGGSATATPATLAVATGVPAPVVEQDATAPAGTLAAGASFPAPAVSATQSASVSPASLAVSTTTPAAGLSTGETVPGAILAVSTTVPVPSVSGAAATVTAVTVPVTVTFPAPEVNSVPFTGQWLASPLHPRWQATSLRPRWQATSLWHAMGGPMFMFEPISALSLENVSVLWTTELAGTETDPTGATSGQPELTVQFAFPLSSGDPLAPAEPSVWYAGAWLTGTNIRGYVAQTLVGPGGGVVTLTAGQDYDAWSKIDGSPESPEKFAGVLGVF